MTRNTAFVFLIVLTGLSLTVRGNDLGSSDANSALGESVKHSKASQNQPDDLDEARAPAKDSEVPDAAVVIQACSFQAVVSDNPQEYASYQVKVTYMGVQTKTTPTLLLAGMDRRPDVKEFAKFRSKDVHYGNDDVKVMAISVDGGTIQRIMTGLAANSDLQVPAAKQFAGGFKDPIYSLMVQRGAAPKQIVFEHLGDELAADEVMNIITAASRKELDKSRDIIRCFRNFTIGPQ